MNPTMTVSGNHEQGKIPGLLLILLHLLPGLTLYPVWLVLSHVFIQHGYTGYLALLMSIPLCLAPVELGVILYWSRRFTGRKSLMEAVLYRRRGAAADYLWIPLLLYVCYMLLSIPLSPVSQYLESHLAIYLPSWARQAALIAGLTASPPAQRAVALVLGVILSGLVASICEELYFRGFLLPRMERWGWAAPVVNALLFAIGHFYFPGSVPGVFVAFLPISCVAMYKKDWRIGAIVHILFNLSGVFTMAYLTG